MIRFSLTSLAIFAALASSGQSLLVNTRSLPFEVLDKGHNALQIDLGSFLQRYDAPGPVATFTFSMPVVDQVKTLFVERKWNPATDSYDLIRSGQTLDLTTYQLQSGAEYDHAYAVLDAADFVWETVEVQFQLFAEEAPISVANFMSYVNEGEFDNTIVHALTIEGLGQNFISQAGGFRLSGLADRILGSIENRGAINFEVNRDNTEGTLAMFRSQNQLNSASSQFFINLSNNSSAFFNGYAVFGEVLSPDSALPALRNQASGVGYNLTRWPFAGSSFETLPLYTPNPENKASYASFDTIRVTQGNPDGVSYSWEFLNAGDEPTEDELANQAAFDVQIADGNLTVSPLNTGFVDIKVTGTVGDQTASFQSRIVHFNQRALSQFPSSNILQGGRLQNSWYDFFEAHSSFPWILHDNHGWQRVAQYPIPDVVINPNVLYVYDVILESWLYMESVRYPRMFHFNLNQWIYYAETTGSGIDDSRTPRWFYIHGTADSSGFWANENDPRLKPPAS